MYRLLLIDDDREILDINQLYFSQLGFEVFIADNAKDALSVVKSATLDCVVLDIGLPDSDGYSLCAAIKDCGDIPLIFLSNYTDDDSRVKGFVSGGDDYLSKPCNLRELELRIYARIKQLGRKMAQPEILKFPPLVINASTRVVYCNDQNVELTPAEFDILVFLARNPNQVFSHAEIYNAVWQMPSINDSHTLQVHVAKVRQKLNEICDSHSFIQTIKGKGYKFVP